jgi:hypothetical protein
MAFWQLEGFQWHFQLPQPKGKKKEISFDFIFPMAFSTTKS